MRGKHFIPATSTLLSQQSTSCLTTEEEEVLDGPAPNRNSSCLRGTGAALPSILWTYFKKHYGLLTSQQPLLKICFFRKPSHLSENVNCFLTCNHQKQIPNGQEENKSDQMYKVLKPKNHNYTLSIWRSSEL